MGFLPGAQHSKRGGSIVIRTIWIAALCLAGLGGLFATRVTASISEEAVRDPATVGINLLRDTLIKSDRLDVGYLRYPVESTAVVPAGPVATEIRPTVPLQPTTPSTTATAGSPHVPAPVTHPGARRSIVLLPKPRPRIRPAKNKKDVGLARAAVDPNTCHQQDGLGGLLISLSGAPRCEL